MPPNFAQPCCVALERAVDLALVSRLVLRALSIGFFFLSWDPLWTVMGSQHEKSIRENSPELDCQLDGADRNFE